MVANSDKKIVLMIQEMLFCCNCRKWITIMWTLLLRVQLHWEICSQNKENRKKQKMSHTAGQQSFSQVHDKKLQESGEESLKVDFFRITHVKKNLEPIDEESSKKLVDIIGVSYSSSKDL
ncbi:uncharacterized protein LOC122065542 [Macadamia integrifolia]|uniref:uncharacterized protein LOC122065542 n=1 Tax=Macadamia integrifolia TaxID=60698 RepID=UPI001C5022FF|nr:uncharacterized protein LOC122065542 [Macadamia integrifolia]